MTSYLIGIRKQLLFLIQDVYKINIDENSDSIELYGKDKKLKFFTNKIDTDFVTEWGIEDELPEAMKAIYSVSSSKEEEEPEPEVQTPEPEPTPEPEQETGETGGESMVDDDL